MNNFISYKGYALDKCGGSCDFIHSESISCKKSQYLTESNCNEVKTCIFRFFKCILFSFNYWNWNVCTGISHVLFIVFCDFGQNWIQSTLSNPNNKFIHSFIEIVYITLYIYTYTYQPRCIGIHEIYIERWWEDMIIHLDEIGKGWIKR